MKLSDKIIILRKQHGMSQEDLAERLNISRQAISRWENGSATPDASNILQSVFFGVLSIMPFVALVGGFEYAYKKNGKNENETSAVFRKNFYKISAWLGLYFPTRLLVTAAMHFYSHPYSAIIFEIMVVSTYLMLSTIVVLSIEKKAQI